MPLIPCSTCLRHLRAQETKCPFCGSATRKAAWQAKPAPALKRAALFALGASLNSACEMGDIPREDDNQPAASSAGMVNSAGMTAAAGAGETNSDAAGAAPLAGSTPVDDETLTAGAAAGEVGGAGADEAGGAGADEAGGAGADEETAGVGGEGTDVGGSSTIDDTIDMPVAIYGAPVAPLRR